ncbi:ermin [Anomaloglossus baeobatrachus]|uniref:ermin n=1 Tax=Anomaloglossus baeobatrachus TaxID=238106 RepID=UPI003F4FC333
MAEEAQATEYNGTKKPEIIPVQITDVVDQMDISIVCEPSQCDSGFTRGYPDVLLEDKIITTSALDLNDQKEEERKEENNTILEKVPDVLDNHEKEFKDFKEDGCQTRIEIDIDKVPSSSPEDISQQDKDQDGNKVETPDILLYQESHHQTGTGDILIEPEEENTSTETDIYYGDGSYDERENGRMVSPHGQHLDPNEMAGSRPDISRHSYSKYDTVSYRKIRKGNTKQRIDEFESMVNL